MTLSFRLRDGALKRKDIYDSMRLCYKRKGGESRWLATCWNKKGDTVKRKEGERPSHNTTEEKKWGSSGPSSLLVPKKKENCRNEFEMEH